MSAAEYLGIDVGGTGVKMGIVHSDTGQINNFQSYDTATWRESHHFLDRLADAIALQYVALHKQHRSAWTHEMDLRPWTENF